MLHFIYWNLNVFTAANLFYSISNWNYLVKYLRFYLFIILSHYFYTNLEGWLWISMSYCNEFYNLSVRLCAFYEDNLKTLFRHIVVVNHVGWLLITITLKDGKCVTNIFFYILLFYIILSIIIILVCLFTTVPHSTEDTFCIN